MSELSFPLWTSTIIVSILAVAVHHLWRSFVSKSKHLPPGPRPDPFIGNLRQMPIHYQEKTFAEWGNVYGDVVYAQVFGKSLVILNSLQAARDLLEKRSSKYSDRPRFVLLTELMGWDAVTTHIQYGDRHRKHRRFIQEYFNRQAITSYRPIQERETIVLLQGLLTTPHSYMLHIRRFAASSIVKITYGHTVENEDEPYVRLVNEVGTATVQSGSPGSTLVDILPPLKYIPRWMPGAGFKRRALRVRERLRSMLDTPFQDVKEKLALGTALPSFTAYLLEKHQGDGAMDPQDEEDIKGVAGVLYSAASDTTVSVLCTFILAMVVHPNVYKKLQDEIDRVVGTDRLPNLNDRDALPFFECVLMEVYRWNAAAPLGMPHRVMEDDIYREFHIPKGAMIIPNIWAMTQDAIVYPQPHLFLPERFMGPDGRPDRTNDPCNMVFGFGRRVCPGKHFADTNIWLASACIAATLDVSEPLDQTGQPFKPTAAFTSGFISHPEPFKCEIQPRSSGVAAAVLHMAVNGDQ